MKHATGDIWALADSHWLIIPVNAGWSYTGNNVMGRGLAKQASLKFPTLPAQYGAVCKEQAATGRANQIYVCPDEQLIMFPTKPLNPAAPHLSWKQNSDINLIAHSCAAIQSWIDHGFNCDRPVAFPLVGCGAGNLQPDDVLAVLEKYFGPYDNVVLVREGTVS